MLKALEKCYKTTQLVAAWYT